MTVRIMFKYPKNYIDIEDPAEVDALVEALVIRLDSRDPKLQSASVFSPFATRETVEGFLRGRRHALGQSLRSLSVYNQEYEQDVSLHPYRPRTIRFGEFQVQFMNDRTPEDSQDAWKYKVMGFSGSTWSVGFDTWAECYKAAKKDVGVDIGA